ncbi:MAG: hypothetical protein KKH83_07405, partial [Candidatus Margulisbacteria bacterium]|nr:hypothetical protein [Candidatus Margulisiibacteriota bacterium]
MALNLGFIYGCTPDNFTYNRYDATTDDTILADEARRIEILPTFLEDVPPVGQSDVPPPKDLNQVPTDWQIFELYSIDLPADIHADDRAEPDTWPIDIQTEDQAGDQTPADAGITYVDASMADAGFIDGQQADAPAQADLAAQGDIAHADLPDPEDLPLLDVLARQDIPGPNPDALPDAGREDICIDLSVVSDLSQEAGAFTDAYPDL